MSIIKDVIVRFKGDASGVDRASKQVKGSLGGITKQLGGLAAGFAGAFAIQAVVGDAIKTIKEFEQSMANLASITGASAADMDQFGGAAIDLSKQFGTSAGEIVKGFALVKSAMAELDTQGVIEVTEAVDVLSKAAGLDMVTATNALTLTMNQFGVEASKSSEVVDILATSQQKGTATIAQLAESFKNVGSAAKASGLDVTETSVALQALAKGGVVGAEAGTKLRGILIKLAETGRSDLNPATNDMVDILQTLKDEELDLTKATEMFGAENAAAALTMIDQINTVRTLSGEMKNLTSAYDQAVTNTDTLNGQLDKSKASWDALILSVEDGDGAISSFFKDALSKGTEWIDQLTELNEGGFGGLVRGAKDALPELEQMNAAIRKMGQELTDIDIQEALDAGDGEALKQIVEDLRAAGVDAGTIALQFDDVLEGIAASEAETLDFAKSVGLVVNEMSTVQKYLGNFPDLEKVFTETTRQTREEMHGVADAADDASDSTKSIGDAVEEVIPQVEDLVLSFEKMPTAIEQAEDMLANFSVDDVGAFDTPEEMASPEMGDDAAANIRDIDAAAISLGETFESIATGGAVEAFEGIGTAIGQAAAGVGGMSSVMTAGLQAIGGMLERFGKALIAYSVSVELFKEGLKISPAAGIIGGIALIAAGAALKSIEIPAFAAGTIGATGGLSLVGEFGPELVNLPAGAAVSSASKTKGMMGGGGRMVFIQRGDSLIATASESTRATRFINGPSSAIGTNKSR